MLDFGPSGDLVSRLIVRAGSLLPDEAADLFRARAYYMMRYGGESERVALRRASRAAKRTGRHAAYLAARRAAAAAWRRARHGTVGPWLTVGGAVANAAGALVVEDVIDEETYTALYGPWRQALGANLMPVGPGYHAPSIGAAVPQRVVRSR